MTGCRLVVAFTTLMLVVLSAGQSTSADEVSIRFDVRRVNISLGFAGQQIFVNGMTHEDTRSVVSVIQAPHSGPRRIVEREKRLIFWPAVRLFLINDVPGLYIVSLHDPQHNVLKTHLGPVDSAAVNSKLATIGARIGPVELFEHARIQTLRGDEEEIDVDRLLSRFWDMQVAANLYAIRANTIRVTDDGHYYYSVTLPAEAPEGKYLVTTYLLSDHQVEVETANLVVRRSGIVSVVSRSASQSPLTYGLLTVLLAVCTGWLGGSVIGRPEGRR